MQLYALGCNGWMPGKNQTSCFLIETDEASILLDAGTGIANLELYKKIITAHTEIIIILSHFHLDHIIGLTYLSQFCQSKHLTILGPGRYAYSKSTEEYLYGVFKHEYHSRALESIARHVTILDYPANTFEIAGIKISVTPQHHTSPSFRISLDEKIVYATDTSLRIEDWENVQPGLLLLHEAWSLTEAKDGHTSVQDILLSRVPEMFSMVGLIHQNPFWSTQDFQTIQELLTGTNTYLLSDGWSINTKTKA